MRKIVQAIAIVLALTSIARAEDLFNRRSDFVVTWTASMPATSKGYGLALRPRAMAATRPSPDVWDWRYPEVSGGFAIGFNTFDPVREDVFNADGNIEHNPEREASLHLGGREIANRLSPVGLGKIELPTMVPSEPAQPTPARMRLGIHFVSGGAEVTLSVGSRPIYDGYFVPELLPLDYVPDFGGDARITEIESHWEGPSIAEPAPPVRVVAFDHALTNNAHPKEDRLVDFPADTQAVGRVIATLTLDKTPQGIDGWDRIGRVYIKDDDGVWIELIRYMTAYRKGWQWKTDVTDMLPLLKGRHEMVIECGTIGEGWLASLDLDFYPGRLQHIPYKVTTIWDKMVMLGEKRYSTIKQLPPTELAMHPETTMAKLRTLVSGHGMDDNDAAEFFPLWRKVHVGELLYTDELWKTDNYLNPCSPQGGTWKYSRAGWGPGTVVQPWTIDITQAIRGGTPPTLTYEIEPYESPRPAGFGPQQLISVQLIEFR